MHEVDEVVVLDVLLGKLLLADKARVRNPKHGVTVPWHHPLRVEQRPGVLDELLVRRGLCPHFLHSSHDKVQDFLVGKAVQRAGEPVEACREREVWV
jgi:hypothetical protein